MPPLLQLKRTMRAGSHVLVLIGQRAQEQHVPVPLGHVGEQPGLACERELVRGRPPA